MAAIHTENRVAVLVACHDDGATLAETIDSLRGEAATELIMVDDGSTDPATLKALVAIESAGVRVLHQQNAGPASAWMAGLRATSAPYVLPFSSDDILVPGATALLADALDANPETAFAWGDIKTFGLATAYRPTVPELCPWLVTFTNCMPAYSLFRRDALLEVGGWHIITASEDWDLWMRMAAEERGGIHVPRPIYLYRRGHGGRFRRRGRRYEPFYEELRERNAVLFSARRTNRSASPAPRILKVVLPIVDKLPAVPRLKKMQFSEALTLLFWSGGVCQTARILAQGVVFRTRALRRNGTSDGSSRPRKEISHRPQD
jgi:glycosyltransferase involved in cell wall biosynthesis